MTRRPINRLERAHLVEVFIRTYADTAKLEDAIETTIAAYERPRVTDARAKLVLDAVTRYCDVDLAQISGPDRRRYVVEARHVAIALLRDVPMTHREIGKLLTQPRWTVLNAIKQVATSPRKAAAYRAITAELVGPEAAATRAA